MLLGALGGVCRGLRGEGYEWRWEGDAQKERERRERREGREKEEEGKRVEREEVRRLERERKEEERVRVEEERVRKEEEEEERRVRELEEEEKEKERRREEVEREEERLRKVREEALEEEAKRQREEEEARKKEQEQESVAVKPEEPDQQTPLVGGNEVETHSGDVEMSDPQPQAQLPPIQTTTNTISHPSPATQTATNPDLAVLAQNPAIDPSLPSEPSQPIQSTSSSDPQPLEFPPNSERPSAPEPTPVAGAQDEQTPSLPEQVDAALSTAPSRATSQQPQVTEQPDPIEEAMEVDPSTAEQPETPVIDQDPVAEEEAEVEIEEPRRRSGRNTARAAGGSRLDALGGGGGTVSRGISYSPDPYSHGATTPQLQAEESEIETISQPLIAPARAPEEEAEEEEEELPLVPMEDLPEYASRLVDPEGYVRSLFVSDKEVELEKCVSGPNGISGTGIMESLSSNEQEALVHDCLTYVFLSSILHILTFKAEC